MAEILPNLVALMNDAGIDTGWRILHGNSDFFAITKKLATMPCRGEDQPHQDKAPVVPGE